MSGMRRGRTVIATAPIRRPLVITVLEEMNRYGLLARYQNRPPMSLNDGMTDGCTLALPSPHRGDAVSTRLNALFPFASRTGASAKDRKGLNPRDVRRE